MVFRCAVRDDNLLPYSEWYLEIPHWPYGLGAYLYGMRLIQHVDATGKENPPGELNTAISRSVLFANSRAARRATGCSARLTPASYRRGGTPRDWVVPCGTPRRPDRSPRPRPGPFRARR